MKKTDMLNLFVVKYIPIVIAYWGPEAVCLNPGAGGACWNPVQRVCSLGSESLSMGGWTSG